jgi:hypothetical protein
MLREKSERTGTVGVDTTVPSADGSTRRRNRRRKLRFGRGGVLRVDGRSHIVGVVDLSVGGAYLSTRTSVAKARELTLLLRLPSGIELALPCEVLRINQHGNETLTHPRGIAVSFHDLDETSQMQLETFVAAGDSSRKAG